MKKKSIVSAVVIVICVALLISANAFAGEGFTSIESPVNAENLVTSELEGITDSKESSKAKKQQMLIQHLSGRLQKVRIH